MLIVKNKQIVPILFSDAPWHFGLHLSNTEQEFLPTDTKEHFEKLCQTEEYREYFKAQGWLEPGAITYKINTFGFRCEEFEPNSNCVVALGCSFTLGIGLPVETIWPNLVGKELGLTVYNLAWGGNSSDTCFRLAEYWLPKLKPKAVFMLTPPASRFELLLSSSGPHKVEVFMPAAEISYNHGNYDNYLKHWYSEDENSRLNRRKNQLAIKGLADDVGIPCFIYNAEDWMAHSREELGYARDRMHAGPDGHEKLAKRILDDWRKKHT
jgi:hypothetical protein